MSMQDVEARVKRAGKAVAKAESRAEGKADAVRHREMSDPLQIMLEMERCLGFAYREAESVAEFLQKEKRGAPSLKYFQTSAWHAHRCAGSAAQVVDYAELLLTILDKDDRHSRHRVAVVAEEAARISKKVSKEAG